MAIAVEWQEWKVVSNHYSSFQSNPSRKFMQLFNVAEDLNGTFSSSRMQVDARNYVFLIYHLENIVHCSRWGLE